MRLALLPALLCLPACLALDGGGDDSYPVGGSFRVAAAGTSSASCADYCEEDLAIEGRELTLTLRSDRAELADIVNRGALSPAAVIELAALTDALDGQVLREVYGCPDCADGGASHLTLAIGTLIRRSSWESPSPPAALAALDAVLFDDLIPALRDCVATSRVTPLACTPPS